MNENKNDILNIAGFDDIFEQASGFSDFVRITEGNYDSIFKKIDFNYISKAGKTNVAITYTIKEEGDFFNKDVMEFFPIIAPNLLEKNEDGTLNLENDDVKKTLKNIKRLKTILGKFDKVDTTSWTTMVKTSEVLVGNTLILSIEYTGANREFQRISINPLIDIKF